MTDVASRDVVRADVARGDDVVTHDCAADEAGCTCGVVVNDTCATAVALPGPGTYAGTTVCHANNFPSPE